MTNNILQQVLTTPEQVKKFEQLLPYFGGLLLQDLLRDEFYNYSRWVAPVDRIVMNVFVESHLAPKIRKVMSDLR